MAKRKRRSSKKDNDQYINTSFFIKNLIDEDGEKEKFDFEEGETEEITFSLTEEKAEQLLEKLQEAMEAQEGDGGVRVSLYCKLAVFDDNEYETASILVLPKLPPQKGKGKKKSFGKGGGGRKSYPSSRRSKKDDYEDEENDYEADEEEEDDEEEEETTTRRGKRGGKATGKKSRRSRQEEADDEDDDGDDIPF